MKFEAKIRFEEGYLPTKRHRIPRIREVEEVVAVELREVKKDDAPVAMVVTDYQSYLDENGKNQFGLRDCNFHAVDGQLYSEKRDMSGSLDRGVYSFDEFLDDLERSGDCRRAWNASERSKEDMLRSVAAFMDSHLMIDGVIYKQTNEPRYVVMTFGLGHNHGGTAMMITQHYNSNISKDCYFTALERDKAVAYADKVAKARGDTKNVGTFDSDTTIKVFMPEMVHCDPQREHGDGDPFMNSMEALVQCSGSAMEAGLLVMSATGTQSLNNKPSLENQIQSASTRAAESHSSDKSQVKQSTPNLSGLKPQR